MDSTAASLLSYVTIFRNGAPGSFLVTRVARGALAGVGYVAALPLALIEAVFLRVGALFMAVLPVGERSYKWVLKREESAWNCMVWAIYSFVRNFFWSRLPEDLYSFSYTCFFIGKERIYEQGIDRLSSEERQKYGAGLGPCATAYLDGATLLKGLKMPNKKEAELLLQEILAVVEGEGRWYANNLFQIAGSIKEEEAKKRQQARTIVAMLFAIQKIRSPQEDGPIFYQESLREAFGDCLTSASIERLFFAYRTRAIESPSERSRRWVQHCLMEDLTRLREEKLKELVAKHCPRDTQDYETRVNLNYFNRELGGCLFLPVPLLEEEFEAEGFLKKEKGKEIVAEFRQWYTRDFLIDFVYQRLREEWWTSDEPFKFTRALEPFKFTRALFNQWILSVSGSEQCLDGEGQYKREWVERFLVEHRFLT